MLISLYKTKDSNNTLNKTMTDKLDFNIKFKETANILSPRIRIRSDVSLIGYNYGFIPEFERFYFITDIDIMNDGIFSLSLRCDVIESFKSDLLECTGLVTKKTDGRGYLNVPDYDIDVRKECDIYKSDKTLIDQLGFLVVLLKAE